MRDYSAEDREQRERLERNSGGGQRANVVGMVNQLAKIHDKRALPGLSAYGVIRLLQSNGGAQAKAARRHNRAHDAFLERLHPGSELARAAAEPDRAGNDPPYRERFVSPLEAERVGDADGSMAADGRTCAGRWDDQGVFSVEDMARLTAAKARASRYF